MSKVSRSEAGANPGRVEGTHFAPPPGVRRIDLDADGHATVPWALLKLNPTARQLRVFFAVDAWAREEGRAYCIPGSRRFETVGLNEGTARKAIDWWAALGIFVLEKVLIGGVLREVIHCPWLMKDAWAGAVIDFGHGVGFDVDKGKRVATGKPARRPPVVPFACAPGGAKCAPGDAHPGAPKEFEFPEGERSNARPCVAAFAPGGDGEQSGTGPIPSPGSPAPPCPVDPGPDPGKVAELVAVLRSDPPTARALVGLHAVGVRDAYHDLVRLGPGLVPTDLAAGLADRFGAPPAPEPVRVRAEVAPPPASTKALIFRLANPTGPEAVEEVVNRLARDLRGKPASLAGNVRDAAAGAIPPAFLWEAYEQAMGPGAKVPPAVFNAAVKRMRLGVPR